VADLGLGDTSGVEPWEGDTSIVEIAYRVGGLSREEAERAAVREAGKDYGHILAAGERREHNTHTHSHTRTHTPPPRQISTARLLRRGCISRVTLQFLVWER
jgi:hypothetical protein